MLNCAINEYSLETVVKTLNEYLHGTIRDLFDDGVIFTMNITRSRPTISTESSLLFIFSSGRSGDDLYAKFDCAIDCTNYFPIY